MGCSTFRFNGGVRVIAHDVTPRSPLALSISASVRMDYCCNDIENQINNSNKLRRAWRQLLSGWTIVFGYGEGWYQ